MPEQNPIVRIYDASKNPENGMLIGVPLSDLTLHQWNGLQPWQQASVDACPFYSLARNASKVAPRFGTAEADETTAPAEES